METELMAFDGNICTLPGKSSSTSHKSQPYLKSFIFRTSEQKHLFQTAWKVYLMTHETEKTESVCGNNDKENKKLDSPLIYISF